MSEDTSAAGQPTILVVDDDWMNREMMQAYLGRSGFQVLVAHDALTALEQAEALRPDLIMLDVRMGETDGFEVCQELKTRTATRSIPVVMLSALSTQEARERASSVGAASFITKTMNLAAIVAQIRALIERVE
jgi:DNA-binding response OmpR family regulator